MKTLREDLVHAIDELQEKINLFHEIPEILFSDFVAKERPSLLFETASLPALESVKRPENPVVPQETKAVEVDSDNDFYYSVCSI